MPYLDGWCLGGMTEDLLELGGSMRSLRAVLREMALLRAARRDDAARGARRHHLRNGTVGPPDAHVSGSRL
jgi:hypothetical protein